MLKKLICLAGVKPDGNAEEVENITTDNRYSIADTESFSTIIEPSEGQSVEEAAALAWWDS